MYKLASEMEYKNTDDRVIEGLFVRGSMSTGILDAPFDGTTTADESETESELEVGGVFELVVVGGPG